MKGHYGLKERAFKVILYFSKKLSPSSFCIGADEVPGPGVSYGCGSKIGTQKDHG